MPNLNDDTQYRLTYLEDTIIEINSKLDAREQEILDLYARIDSLEAELKWKN